MIWTAYLPQPLDSKLCGGDAMKATQRLRELGQSVWLDNITRDLLASGTLERYIAEAAGISLDRGQQNP